jgi:O-antigen ligase
VLHRRRARLWMGRVLTACAVYIGAQAALQFATGVNLYGDRRGVAGELTGPFDGPRAGPPLSRLLLAVAVPSAVRLLGRGQLRASVMGYGLLLLALCLMVVISQRMPLVLTAFGLLVASLLLPRLRPAVVLAGVAGLALLAASAVVSPPTWQRVVVQFSNQLDHFSSSHYGFLFNRSLVIAASHPLTGGGFDGFRNNCPLTRYDPDGLRAAEQTFGTTEVCAPHPHNFFLQALVEGGAPGLILFCGLTLAWLGSLGSGLWRDPEPLRVGLFAAALIQLWPLASTSAFTSMPMGGWFFLLLGWGLAEARWRV